MNGERYAWYRSRANITMLLTSLTLQWWKSETANMRGKIRFDRSLSSPFLLSALA